MKSGKRICGSGAALANAAIVQNKCYFEMKIQSGGKHCKEWEQGLIPPYSFCRVCTVYVSITLIRKSSMNVSSLTIYVVSKDLYE